MEKVKVTSGIVQSNGKSYYVNDELVVNEEQADRLVNKAKVCESLGPVKEVEGSDDGDNQEDGENAGIDIESLSKEELKSYAEENGIEVTPTGKNGSFLKDDYVDAIVKSNEEK